MITLQDLRKEDQRGTAFDSVLAWLAIEGSLTWKWSVFGGKTPPGLWPYQKWQERLQQPMMGIRSLKPFGPPAPASTLRAPNLTPPNLGRVTGTTRRITGDIARRSAKASTVGRGIKDLRGSAKLFNFGFMLTFGMSLAQGALEGITSISTQRSEMASASEEPTYFGGAAYTQRQRALAAIHNSQLTVRSIFGNEAAYVH